MARFMILPTVGGLVLFALLATGRESAVSSRQVTVSPTETASAPSTNLSPGERKRARLAAAMVGLTYEADREVVVNEGASGPDPQAASAAFERGVALLAHNERIEAVGAFTQAVILDDAAADHYRGLGEALLTVNKTDEAIAALRTALARDPDDIESHYWLAEAFGARVDLAGARDQFETVVERDPRHGRAWSRLAVFRYYTDDRVGAQTALDRADTLGAAIPGQLAALIAGTVPRATVRTIRSANANDTSAVATGVTVGPQIRIDQGGIKAANETTIIMDDAPTPTLVAGWNDYREREPGMNRIRVGVAVSDDGGVNWTESIVRPPVPFQGNSEGDPMTAYDPRTGHFWVGGVSFDNNGGLFIARKVPDAPTFETPVMAEISGTTDKPWMVAGPAPGDTSQTALYVAFNHGVISSNDLGATWTAPTSLGLGLGFMPLIDSAGTLYVSYWNQSKSIRVARTDTGGPPFTTLAVATRMYGAFSLGGEGIPGTFRAPFLTHMTIDADDTLYAVWYDATTIIGSVFNFDIYFARSEDRGQTWTSPVVINGDATPAGDQWLPWIQADPTGRLHMMYYDTRDGAQNDNAAQALITVYYSYSDDRGDSWTEMPITDAFNSELDGRVGAPNAFIGDYQTLAANSTLAVPCYLSNQNGDSDIFVNRIERDALLVGDMNCDGAVSVGDINPFVLALTDALAYADQFPDCDILAGDCNGDTQVTVGDINCFVALVTGG